MRCPAVGGDRWARLGSAYFAAAPGLFPSCFRVHRGAPGGVGGWKEEFKSLRISYVISHGLTTYALRLRQ